MTASTLDDDNHVSHPRAGTETSQTSQHADLLTVIITTSPTPSAPSTELLSQILVAFRAHCPELSRCRVILVLDTYDHISSTARLKKGHVTAEGARKYAEYKANAKRLILEEYALGGGGQDLVLDYGEAEFGSVAYAQQTNAVPLDITKTADGRVLFIEPAQRLGFGLAVRSALRLTETPYVWIQQHDWALIADVPLNPLLTVMQQHAQPTPDAADLHDDAADTRVPIKYVCFPSVRMVQYARSDHVMQFPALRALTNLHKQNFTVRSEEDGFSAVRIPLTPMFFWHDKPHVAETAHYLAQVFSSRVAVPRGAFIEDTVGHRARTEMKEGQWKKWACWLYYPDEGKQLCMRHLKGRTWRGTEGELSQKLEYIRLNQEGEQEQATRGMKHLGEIDSL